MPLLFTQQITWQQSCWKYFVLFSGQFSSMYFYVFFFGRLFYRQQNMDEEKNKIESSSSLPQAAPFALVTFFSQSFEIMMMVQWLLFFFRVRFVFRMKLVQIFRWLIHSRHSDTYWRHAELGFYGIQHSVGVNVKCLAGISCGDSHTHTQSLFWRCIVVNWLDLCQLCNFKRC